jgi:dolichol-phosphate mannosyltransferase
MKSIHVIIPCYNEVNGIDALIAKIDNTIADLPFHFKYLFVDDGSSDGTFEHLSGISKERKDIRVLKLSRNFGSHIAVSAGLENSTDCDAIILLTADLQEPPELIPELIKKWEEGYEVVFSIREKRSQSFIGKYLSLTFHKLFVKGSGLKNYPKEGPSGFLLDKKVCKHWCRFKESHRMIVGLIAWMGFKQTQIYYKQNKRFAGRSSWNYTKLVKLAIDSFVSFSYAPIRLITYFGLLISFIGFLYSIILMIGKIFYGIGPTGWTSIMVLILFLGGIQLITLGVLGEYIWRGVDETRNRPLYLISEKINFNDTDDDETP